MKKLMAVVTAIGCLAVGSIWLSAQRNDTRKIDTLLPPGAIFYLEAKDFHQILTQWNTSDERRRWLKSDNATVLSQSRLLQRLMQAQDQYATVAGLPVEMNLVNELAGSESGFAFYEFSTVHFVYVTHIDATRLGQSSLWKSRGSYQTREAAGIRFYVKTQTAGRETYTVAFASHDGWLIVATEPTLMASTLTLLAGQAGSSISRETWYEDTVKQIPQQGDLRLVYNFTTLRKSAQFRTYWVQKNASESASFTSGSADLFQLPTGFEERRVLIQPPATAEKVDNTALTQVVSNIPQNASLYRAWARPSRVVVRATLAQVVLSESASGPTGDKEAPQVSSQASLVGSESDLETRIDEPAFQKSSDDNIDLLTDTVMAMEPKALLHSQLTQMTGDRVFVFPESELALVLSHADRSAFDASLKKAMSVVKTGSLDPLRISEDGGVLVMSRLAPHAAMTSPSVAAGAIYIADYEHSSEWPRYGRLFNVIDHKTGTAPMFFSNNIQSLGNSLHRLRRVSMTTQQEDLVTRDTIRYEFSSK